MMRIVDYGFEFHIQWEYNYQHKRNLEAVKAIPDRQYINGEKKYWRAPNTSRDHVLQLQKTHGATVVIPENMKPEEIGEVPPIAELTTPVALKPDVILRPYQAQGIAQAMLFKRCLIGDEQGLGKTLQAIGCMVGLNAFPCIVVCPSSMKATWKREWDKFSHKKAIILDSQTMSKKQKLHWFEYVRTGNADVVIINYESLNVFCVESYPQGKADNGKKKRWGAIDVILRSFMSNFKGAILDESHRCSDSTTNQSKFILRIFNGIENRLLLTGTPVRNKPIDLFPQLAVLGVLHLFGGRKGFIERYCEGGSGANNMRELNYKLKLHCYFRREKKDVAKDLPEKQRQTILCDITNRTEYLRCKNDFEKFLRDSGCDDAEVARKMRGEIMVQMQKLKQISARGKMNEVKEFVNEVLESGEKLILFCHLHEIVDECKAIWPHAVTITGRDDMKQRQAHIDAFQGCKKCGVNLQDHGKDHDFIPSDTKLIICNHKAAGVGITLTTSSRVAFIEYPWTYADCVQCEDRAHRIGQTNNVMCTYFLGQDTIDERMWEIISNKMTIGNTITGATDMMDSMEMIDKTLSLFKI